MSLVLVMGGDVNGLMLCGKRWRHCGGWQAKLPSNRIAAASCHRCGDLACLNMAPSWRRPATRLKVTGPWRDVPCAGPRWKILLTPSPPSLPHSTAKLGTLFAASLTVMSIIGALGDVGCAEQDVVGQGSLGRDMHVMTKPLVEGFA